MSKRYFVITLRGESVLEIDQAVIDAVDDDWRSTFYALAEPEEIAEMVGRCLSVYNVQLSNLDGWADQPDDHAQLLLYPAWEGEAKEFATEKDALSALGIRAGDRDATPV